MRILSVFELQPLPFMPLPCPSFNRLAGLNFFKLSLYSALLSVHLSVCICGSVCRHINILPWGYGGSLRFPDKLGVWWGHLWPCMKPWLGSVFWICFDNNNNQQSQYFVGLVIYVWPVQSVQFVWLSQVVQAGPRAVGLISSLGVIELTKGSKG